MQFLDNFARSGEELGLLLEDDAVLRSGFKTGLHKAHCGLLTSLRCFKDHRSTILNQIGSEIIQDPYKKYQKVLVTASQVLKSAPEDWELIKLGWWGMCRKRLVRKFFMKIRADRCRQVFKTF